MCITMQVHDSQAFFCASWLNGAFWGPVWTVLLNNTDQPSGVKVSHEGQIGAMRSSEGKLSRSNMLAANKARRKVI